MPRIRPRRKTKATAHPNFKALFYLALFIFFIIHKPFTNQIYNIAGQIVFGSLSGLYLLRSMWKHPGPHKRTLRKQSN
jgi:hypothetical protein